MPRYHLTLVWPHAAYGPPPDLSRPELRAAFEAGRANQADDDLPAHVEQWHELRQQGRAVRQAYWAGYREHLGAPLPLGLDLLLIGVTAVAGVAVQQRTSAVRRAVAGLVLLATTATVMASERHLRRNVTGETAPLPLAPPSMFMHLGIDGLYVLWTWRRDGVRMRAASTAAAAAIVRTLMRRRSWRAAIAGR